MPVCPGSRTYPVRWACAEASAPSSAPTTVRRVRHVAASHPGRSGVNAPPDPCREGGRTFHGPPPSRRSGRSACCSRASLTTYRDRGRGLPKERQMSEHVVSPLQPAIWDGFTGPAERHNGVVGGCWCVSGPSDFVRMKWPSPPGPRCSRRTPRAAGPPPASFSLWRSAASASPEGRCADHSRLRSEGSNHGQTMSRASRRPLVTSRSRESNTWELVGPLLAGNRHVRSWAVTHAWGVRQSESGALYSRPFTSQASATDSETESP